MTRDSSACAARAVTLAAPTQQQLAENAARKAGWFLRFVDQGGVRDMEHPDGLIMEIGPDATPTEIRRCARKHSTSIAGIASIRPRR